MTPAVQILAGLCKFFEGLAQRREDGLIYPYLCPAHYWTHGFGVLCKEDTPPYSDADAERELFAKLPYYIIETLKACPNLVLEPPERLAALADFTFNLGAAALRSSTLRRKVQAGDWLAACKELTRWVNGGGRRLPGLVARRAAEAQLIRKTL